MPINFWLVKKQLKFNWLSKVKIKIYLEHQKVFVELIIVQISTNNFSQCIKLYLLNRIFSLKNSDHFEDNSLSLIAIRNQNDNLEDDHLVTNDTYGSNDRRSLVDQIRSGPIEIPDIRRTPDEQLIPSEEASTCEINSRHLTLSFEAS